LARPGPVNTLSACVHACDLLRNRSFLQNTTFGLPYQLQPNADVLLLLLRTTNVLGSVYWVGEGTMSLTSDNLYSFTCIQRHFEVE
jgi:hypothetical protein